jgi:uncharacterized protein DUF2442
MNGLIKVISANYVADYILELTFNDGVKAEIDFSQWIDRYPFFAPLANLEYFKNFSLDGWTVIWEDGADIAPETLHKIALQNQKLQAA